MNQFLKDRYTDFSITEVVQTGDGYGFEIQLHYKDGSTVWLSGPSCSSAGEAEKSRKEHEKNLRNI